MTSGILDYLAELGVESRPCDHASVGVHPEIPVLPGWEVVPAEVFPSAFQLLVPSSYPPKKWRPNAVLMHGELSAPVDAHRLLTHADEDSDVLPGWSVTKESRDPWLGHPSYFVEGTYAIEDLDLLATTRYVVPTGPDGRMYLTQLTITIPAAELTRFGVDAVTMNAALAIR